MDGRHVPVAEGLPADARVVAVTCDRQFNTFEMLVESEEFELVEPMYVPADLNLTIYWHFPETLPDGRLAYRIPAEE